MGVHGAAAGGIERREIAHRLRQLQRAEHAYRSHRASR